MLKITIIGSGDTLGTPVVGCINESCKDKNPKSKRYRFGLLIENESAKILVDTNPDLKWQCIDNAFELKEIDHILITHTHSDHVNGMGEFFFRRENPTIVHHLNHPLISKHMDYFGYLEREGVLKFNTFENFNTFEIEGLNITPIELNHGFPCSGFIIEDGNNKVSIVSDTSVKLSNETKELLKGSDILFVDTFSEDIEQTRNVYIDCNDPIPSDLSENWYHMTIDNVLELSNELCINKTYTVHMSRYMSPHDELVDKYENENLIISYDGLEVYI